MTWKVENYSACILGAKVCINCSLRVQVSVVSEVKLAQTTTNKDFCLVDIPNLHTSRSNEHSKNKNVAAGRLALFNVAFLVGDAYLAVEYLKIGLSVLQHFCVDREALPEERCDLLDGADCSFAKAANESKYSGNVRRLMIARLNHVLIDDLN